MRLLQVSRSSWRMPTRRVGLGAVTSARFTSFSRHEARSVPSLPDLPAVDRKWQKRWQEQNPCEQPDKPKSYILAMFPYPSGALHMGHLRNYAVTDVLARFKHMQGYNVLHPMGWDAFGLPAENAAIERGVHPAKWTKENTKRMKSQLQAMNSGLDWSREFMTCDPSFYKHTQHLFLLLFRHGLAYQAEALVNYDPIDRTVLANEQVDANGFSWRSGAKVEKIKLRQWFLKITAFQESLLKDLDFLKQDANWPERVLAMQRHWLGRSQGAHIKFAIQNEAQTDFGISDIDVFTTRPDTLFGAQYIALSPSHSVVTDLADQDTELAAWLEEASSLPADSKTGFELPGIYAKNPLGNLPSTCSDLKEHIPIYVAPYVLDSYGTGAVMGVPGHDERDFAFWSENQPDKPVKTVVEPEDGKLNNASRTSDVPCIERGRLASACHPFAGLTSEEATSQIVTALSNTGGASEAETWRLRDWLISRQRYWGTPIPIIHCQTCGAVPVPYDQLPVELPDVAGDWFKSRAGNPLEAAQDWVNVSCPSCGGKARRDTDTMDTFMDSSWYYFRFIDPKNSNQPFEAQKADIHMPVDIYVGGIEHAILHLLYSRFVGKFLAKSGLWPEGNRPDVRGEPFRKLISQGMVHGKTYSEPQSGRFLRPEEVDLTSPDKPVVVRTGEAATITFEKMSKSKHNGVDPSSFIAKYGADATRAHILFQAPITDVLEWEEDRIVGIQRWFLRIWRVVDHVATLPPIGAIARERTNFSDEPLDTATFNGAEKSLYNSIHETIASVTDSLSRTYTLNTCISDLMQLTNQVIDSMDANAAADTEPPVRAEVLAQAASVLIRLLTPFAPAFASECWEHMLSRANSGAAASSLDVFNETFPTITTFERLTTTTQTCVVMENGRKRFETVIPAAPGGLSHQDLQDWVLNRLRDTEAGKAWLARKGEAWDRVVVVKNGRTVNFVSSARKE